MYRGGIMYFYILLFAVSMLMSILIRLVGGFSIIALALLTFLLLMWCANKFNEKYFIVIALGLCTGWLSCYFFYLSTQELYFGYPFEANYEVSAYDTEKDILVLQHEDNCWHIRKNKVVCRKASKLFSSLGVDVTKLSEGQLLTLEAQIEKVQEARNPGQSNFRLIYYGKGIVGQVTFVKKCSLLTSDEINLMKSLSDQIRKRITTNIQKGLEKKYLGISLGMSLGDKSYLSSEDEKALRSLGLSHILVVSSLHVGLLLMLFNAQLKYIKIRKFYKESILIILMMGLLMLSVSKVSIIKCIFIYIAHLIGEFYNRKPFYLLSLAVYSVLSLMINPYLLFNLSFTLSLMAYVGVFSLYRYTWRFTPKSLRMWYITACIYVTLTPIFLLTFKGVHYMGLFISPLIMPVLELTIGVNFIQTFINSVIPFPIGGWLLNKLFIFVEMLIAIAEGLGEHFLLVPYANGFLVGLIFLLLTCLLLQKGIPKGKILCRFLGLLFAISLIVAILCHHVPMRVFYLDVGMGDSQLIYKGGTSVLIDGGTPYQKWHLKNVMAYLGEKKIDLAIISHDHQDHYGGILALMEEDAVTEVMLTPMAYTRLSEKYHVFKSYMEDNRIILLEEPLNLRVFKGWDFDMYPPLSPDENVNNESIICVLKKDTLEFMFTGDAEVEEEEALMPMVLENVNVPVDYLKIPHHGSRTSSTERFLLAAQPNYGIISVGQNNRYGLPDEEVVARYDELGTKLHITDASGAYEVKVFYPWVWHRDY